MWLTLKLSDTLVKPPAQWLVSSFTHKSLAASPLPCLTTWALFQ